MLLFREFNLKEKKELIIKNKVSTNEALFPDDTIQLSIMDLDDEPQEINDEPTYDITDTDDSFSLEDIISDDSQHEQVENNNITILSELQALIKDEQEAISGYNAFIMWINDNPAQFSSIPGDIKAVINDIIAEENKHIGQLQTLLSYVNPHQQDIVDGEQEASHQLQNISESGVFVPVRAPLQGTVKISMLDEIRNAKFVDPSLKQKTENVNIDCSGDDICTLANADDEF